MSPMKTDDDEHKKCLGDKTKSDSALSQSKPWNSSNMKISKSDQRIFKSELPKQSCTSSKIRRNSLDIGDGDQHTSPTKTEITAGTLSKVQSNKMNIEKVSQNPQKVVKKNIGTANPEAWKFWTIYVKEPDTINSPHAKTISKMAAPKSTDSKKTDKKVSSPNPKPNPKQVKSNAPPSAPTLNKPKATSVPKPAQKQLKQEKPSNSPSPKSTTAKPVSKPAASVAAKAVLPDPKSSSVPAKDVKAKTEQKVAEKVSSAQSPPGTTSDMKLPPKVEDSQKPKAPNPILAALSRHFNGTQQGRANTMAGDSSVDESQLKGLSKYFNGQTTRGRANVAKATYAAMGVLILYFSLKPSKK